MLGVYLRHYLNTVLGHDLVIDDLIAANRARPRPGMATADPEKVDRSGAQKWQDVLRGQQRQTDR